jgi:hypothetical protein
LTLKAAGRLLSRLLEDNPVETLAMFRTPIIAALTVALLGGTALAQPANAPPADLSNSARNAPDYDDYDDDAPPVPPRGYAQTPPPPAAYDNAQRRPGSQAQPTQAEADRNMAERDVFCRRDAAARTGYTTPGEAARDEQTRGTVGGTLGGAVLGTVLGAAAGNAGLGAAAGAGAGLLAGTAIGADNARHAANDVQAAYSDAYYGCMHEDQRAGYYDNGAPRPGYAYGPSPPPAYYYPAYPAYSYPYPYYYGSGLSFGFGFGGGRGWGHGWGGGHGFHGGGFRHH